MNKSNKLKTVFEEERTDTDALKVPYHYYGYVEEATSYTNDDGSTKMTRRLKLIKHAPIPIGEFMKIYRAKLQQYIYHRGYIRLTSLLRAQRAGFSPGEVSLMMDYSEKLKKERRKQIQSEHWVDTEMAIEVGVAQAYPASLSAEELADLQQRLRAAADDERKDVGKESQTKRIYYHCSDHKPQVAAVTTHNMEVMLKEMIASGELQLKPGSQKYYRTAWLKTDGCAKQYKCGKAMYLLCVLAHRSKVTIDQMLEVTGHGKDEADGHGGVLKNYLIGLMRRVDVNATESEPAVEVEMADVLGEAANSFAQSMVDLAAEHLTHVKQEAMNSKRQKQRSTTERIFRTYTEADIGNPPAIDSMTDALARDWPKGGTAYGAEHDKLVKATLAHNNYRADPELQTDTKKVIMVRRLACYCKGCRARLELPIAQRYDEHDDCVLSYAFGRWNDWKRVELKASSDDAAERMEDDEHLQLQERTDETCQDVGPGIYLAFAAPNDPDCPEGYYVARATGVAYPLDADVTLHELRGEDGKPLELAAGSFVIDAEYLNPVRGVQGTAGWYYPYPADDERRKVRVPSHMVLLAGFAMPAAQQAEPPAYGSTVGHGRSRKKVTWGPQHARSELVREKHAVVLAREAHSAINDELDVRRG